MRRDFPLKQSVLDCLDQLERLIESGITVPVAGKKIINRIEALEIIDQMRILLPEEIRQAALTVDRSSVVDDKRYTGSYVQPGFNAPDRMATSVSKPAAYRRPEVNSQFANTEVVMTAKQEAERILSEARMEAAEIKKGADEYSESTLANLEDTLNRTTKVVKKGLEELERRKSYSDQPVNRTYSNRY